MKQRNKCTHTGKRGVGRLGYLTLMRVCLLLIFISIGLSVKAQLVNTYIFTPLPGTYVPLTGGIAVPSILADDATATSSSPIGFNFTFNGTVYTSVTANSNGWLTFNPVATVNAVDMRTNDLATVVAGLHPLLAPLWDDLDGRTTLITGGTPVASYTTTGAVGSRVFTFEWLNWINYTAVAAPTNISFQVRLYETTNVIEFQYQQNAGTAGFAGATIGISGSNTNFISLNNAVAAPLASTTVSTNTITSRPPSGQIYRFTPPSPCTGIPTAGTVVASPLNVCAGSTSFLSLTGNTIASGLGYQWQDSVAPGTWVDIAGATSSNYTTIPLTAPHYYRAKVICISTNDTVITPPVLLTINSFIPNYFENFESITANNQLPNCMTATNLGSLSTSWTSNQANNRTNHTPAGSKYFSFRWAAGTDVLATPGITLTAGKTYLFNYWYITDGAAGWNTLEAYWGTSPTIAGLTNFIGAAQLPLTNTTYKEFTGTFTVATTGTYFVGIVCNRTTNPFYLTIDDIGLTELLPCNGRPSAGIISPQTPCPNQNFTLVTTGTTSPTSFANLTYQWFDSSNASSWQPSPGASTGITYTTSVSIPTKFKMVATCNNAPIAADTTPVYLVVPASFLNCYCIPTYAAGATNRIITNIKLNTLNNASTGASPFYRDYTSSQPGLIPIPTITMGVTDTIVVSHSTFATNFSSVWIDFNHSGTFEQSEYFSLGTSVGASGIARIPITPPLTALPGITRMRIRGGDGNIVTSAMPCGPTTSGAGEAEDYFVTIRYPLCSGPTNGGRAVASDTAICKGYDIDVYDTTHEYRRSQITWSWENSVDGGFTWNPVLGSTFKDSLLAITINASISYRLKMVCEVTGDSTYSIPVNIRIKAPYECYCYSQSNGGSADSSDIGAVVIGTTVNATGGPHLYNPMAVRRRTDYTYIPNIVLNADGTYRLAIFHTQRNGSHADALVTVFMDFNNDLVYDASSSPESERVYQGITTAGNFYLDTMIRIPNAVIPNVPTGMRVILNNDRNRLSPANLGCGPYVSGETEDYIVTFKRTVTGIANPNGLQRVAIYPNPTAGRFTVTATSKQDMDRVIVTVSTMTGQEAFRKQYDASGTGFSQEIDLGNMARGVYFVSVTAGNGDKMIQKLILR